MLMVVNNERQEGDKIRHHSVTQLWLLTFGHNKSQSFTLSQQSIAPHVTYEMAIVLLIDV